jgi:hypothetical protein
MLIDSIMGTIDHIYCDNTFHVITEQNHRRNTIVRRAALLLVHPSFRKLLRPLIYNVDVDSTYQTY